MHRSPPRRRPPESHRRAHCARREVVFELKPDYRTISNAALLADLKAVVRRLGLRTIGFRAYGRHGRFSKNVIWNRFGSWRRALHAARLPPTQSRDVTPASLIADIRQVARRLRVTRLSFGQYLSRSQYTVGNIRTCFGT